MALLYGDEAEDELETWLRELPFELQGREFTQFWLRKLKYPSSYCLANPIPAISSEYERMFSQGNLLITGRRSRLEVDIIEATQCLRIG